MIDKVVTLWDLQTIYNTILWDFITFDKGFQFICKVSYFAKLTRVYMYNILNYFILFNTFRCVYIQKHFYFNSNLPWGKSRNT